MRVLFGQSSKTFCSDLVLPPVVAWENVLTWSQGWTIAVCVLPDQACKAVFGPWLRRMLDVWTGGFIGDFELLTGEG